MAGPFLDRDRASRLMAAAGIDALVISEPEVFTYATGVSPGVPALFRRAGAAFAVIPADPAAPAAAVIGDLYRENFLARSPIADVATHPIWIETVDVTSQLAAGSNRPIDEMVREAWSASGRPADFARPATFDLQASLKALKGILGRSRPGEGAAGLRSRFRAGQRFGFHQGGPAGGPHRRWLPGAGPADGGEGAGGDRAAAAGRGAGGGWGRRGHGPDRPGPGAGGSARALPRGRAPGGPQARRPSAEPDLGIYRHRTRSLVARGPYGAGGGDQDRRRLHHRRLFLGQFAQFRGGNAQRASAPGP